jgi:hypothetical protein
LTTTEAGGQATFTVVLRTQPSDTVTLPMSSSDTGEGTVSSADVVFTALNWNIPQTITITGVDDDVADGDTVYTIVTGDPTSSDGDYDGASANPVDVSVTNEDDDTAGFTISAISGDTSEDGDSATFTVRLNSEPTDNVVINVTSSDTGIGTVSPSQLTFTSSDWSVEQTVTVTGVDDGDNPTGDQPYTVQLTMDNSTAATEYAALDPDDVSVVNKDNDEYFIFLPVMFNNYADAPDLVVTDISVSGSDVQVTIENQGTAATSDDFWVDMYINPTTPPTGVNQTWETQGGEGLVWGITDVVLEAGGSLTLSFNDAYYVPGRSSFSGIIASGSEVHVQADSANTSTTYGNILENHESYGGAYNNIAQMTVETAVSLSVTVLPETAIDLPRLEVLPQR